MNDRNEHIKRIKECWGAFLLISENQASKYYAFAYGNPINCILEIDQLMQEHQITPTDFGITPKDFTDKTRPYRLEWAKDNLESIRSIEPDLISVHTIYEQVNLAEATLEDIGTNAAEMRAHQIAGGLDFINKANIRANNHLRKGEASKALFEASQIRSVMKEFEEMQLSKGVVAKAKAHIFSIVGALVAQQNLKMQRLAG